MHPYTTDSDERKYIPFLVAVGSILAAWGLYKIFEIIKLVPPWWVDAPSVVGFYGVFYKLFDKWLWQWGVFRKIKLVRVRDLNGTWQGHAASSFDQHATRHDATIKIHQTWSKINISLETSNSKSKSVIAAIITGEPEATLLSYEYFNEPKANAVPRMHAHRGTARLHLHKREAGETLEGEYYSGRDRQNYGSLQFTREPRGNT